MNNWYITIKNYKIHKIFVEENNEYKQVTIKETLGTPLWDITHNIIYWLDKNRTDFEFTKEMDEYSYREYVKYIKGKKNNKDC